MEGQVSLIDLLILVVSLGLATFSCNMIQYGHNQVSLIGLPKSLLSLWAGNHYFGIPKLALNGEMSVESGQVCLIGPCP